jgi:hypothetical protein
MGGLAGIIYGIAALGFTVVIGSLIIKSDFTTHDFSNSTKTVEFFGTNRAVLLPELPGNYLGQRSWRGRTGYTRIQPGDASHQAVEFNVCQHMDLLDELGWVAQPSLASSAGQSGNRCHDRCSD